MRSSGTGDSEDVDTYTCDQKTTASWLGGDGHTVTCARGWIPRSIRVLEAGQIDSYPSLFRVSMRRFKRLEVAREPCLFVAIRRLPIDSKLAMVW
ncbi:hypothetical protein K439DRAFT_1640044 [Ramaria rubella]|nr:hypothetical protein K439DRAFT_1640044 [Ramaria rubella]